MRKSRRVLSMLATGLLVLMLALISGAVSAQTACQACGRCDQDGDGLFTDKKRCQNLCNPANDPLLIDPNDSDAAFCDDPGSSTPQIEAEFTDSDFLFMNSPKTFTVNDRGNRAYNDNAVTLLVPVDNDPGTQEDWDTFFMDACPGLLAAAPPAIDAAPNSIELAKSAGDVRMIVSDINVDPVYLLEGISSAEITFQLVGKDQVNQHFPTRPGDPPVDWVFDMYRIFGSSGPGGGPRVHCDGPAEVLIPDLSTHTLQMQAVP